MFNDSFLAGCFPPPRLSVFKPKINDKAYIAAKAISKKINISFYTMKGYDVDSKELYQNDLFSNEIERFLYSYE